MILILVLKFYYKMIVITTELYDFNEAIKNFNIDQLILKVLWAKDSYSENCVKPFNNECKKYAELIDLENQDLIKISKYFYKGNFYAISTNLLNMIIIRS